VNLFVGSSFFESGIIHLQLSWMVATVICITWSMTGTLPFLLLLLNFITHSVCWLLLTSRCIVIISVTLSLLSWSLTG